MTFFFHEDYAQLTMIGNNEHITGPDGLDAADPKKALAVMEKMVEDLKKLLENGPE